MKLINSLNPIQKDLHIAKFLKDYENNMDKISLWYLQIFYDDLFEVVAYIKIVLQNPMASIDLINLVEKAILKRVRTLNLINIIIL